MPSWMFVALFVLGLFVLHNHCPNSLTVCALNRNILGMLTGGEISPKAAAQYTQFSTSTFNIFHKCYHWVSGWSHRVVHTCTYPNQQRAYVSTQWAYQWPHIRGHYRQQWTLSESTHHHWWSPISYWSKSQPSPQHPWLHPPVSLAHPHSLLCMYEVVLQLSTNSSWDLSVNHTQWATIMVFFPCIYTMYEVPQLTEIMVA